jgi:AraC-like DNA-binding protein
MYRGEASREGKRDASLALVPDPHDRARLHDALATSTEILFVTSVADVLANLRADRAPIRVVILDARDAAGRPTAGLARQVTQLFPAIPVIGYCDAGAEHSRDIVALASAGVHELLFKRDTSPAVMRSVLAAAQQACAADLVLARLDPVIPPRLRPFVEHCLVNPEESHTVAQVARAMGMHRKTFVNRCTTEGAPSPSIILAWCLLLLAGALLAPPGVTVERVAMWLNFPSPSALRNMLKRHTGLRPRDLRGEHGIDLLVTRFAALFENSGSATPLG